VKISRVSRLGNSSSNTEQPIRRGIPISLVLLAVAFVLASCTQDLSATNGRGGLETTAWSWVAVGYSDAEIAGGQAPIQVQATSEGAVEDISITASGHDIWNTRDEFVYYYTKLEADGSLSVRLSSFDPANPWSKAGIMIRKNLEDDAPNALLHISGSNGSVLQTRDSSGASTRVENSSSATKPGSFMRLTRAGDDLIAELSTDGTAWSELGRVTLNLDGPVLIGLAVTANPETEGELPKVRAEFSDLAYMPEKSVAEPSDPTPPTQPTEPTEPAPAPRLEVPQATLYVSPSGSSNNSGRSVDSPLTLAAATSIVRPGDVVYLRGGVYPLNHYFTRSGTRTEPIIWASYPGEWAIFDGSGLRRGSASDRVWVRDASWNVFANFEVRNSPQQGVLVQGSNDNRFYGLITHGNHGSGIQLMNSSRNVLEYIITYDNVDEKNPRGEAGEDADGIGISSGDRNIIRYTVTYSNSDDGIDAWTSTNTLIDSVISFDNGRLAEGDGNGFKLGGPVSSSNTIVQRSIAFNNRSRGFTSNGGSNVQMLNNTAFGNAGVAFQGDRSTTLRNNLSDTTRLDLASASSSHNSWDIGIRNPTFASTSPSNPGFLALAESSPARNAGTDVGLPFSGSAPDLGALQYPMTIAGLVNNPSFGMAELAEVISNLR